MININHEKNVLNDLKVELKLAKKLCNDGFPLHNAVFLLRLNIEKLEKLIENYDK